MPPKNSLEINTGVHKVMVVFKLCYFIAVNARNIYET